MLSVATLGCAGASSSAGSGPLRVGTCGDYSPYSVAASGGYVGVDVDLARDLGRALSRPVLFVRTSFTTLLDDAEAGRFDLAMHGISVTPEREARAAFSIPYHEDSRVAVIRCAEQERFASLEDLNRPDVTVFTNRGGATASYVRRHLPRARLVEESLAVAHERLVAGDGDAVLDTGYQAGRHRGLCLGLGGARFLRTPIAVLFPKGSNLVDPTNEWLQQRIADGTVGRLIEHYGLP